MELIQYQLDTFQYQTSQNPQPQISEMRFCFIGKGGLNELLRGKMWVVKLRSGMYVIFLTMFPTMLKSRNAEPLIAQDERRKYFPKLRGRREVKRTAKSNDGQFFVFSRDMTVAMTTTSRTKFTKMANLCDRSCDFSRSRKDAQSHAIENRKRRAIFSTIFLGRLIPTTESPCNTSSAVKNR